MKSHSVETLLLNPLLTCLLTYLLTYLLTLQREVRPPIRIWDLEIDEEDLHPTSDFYQPQTPVHLGSVVAEKDFEWRAVEAHTARKDWSHHPENEMAMDRPPTPPACPLRGTLRGQAEGQTEDVLEKGTIQQEYEDLAMSWEEVKRTAKNRVRWKAVVGSPMLWSERRGLN